MHAIEVIPNRFTEVSNEATHSTAASVMQSDKYIRRPTRGIVLKNDTYATLRVIAVNGDGTGRPITLIDAGSKRKDEHGNFYTVDGNKRGTDVYSNFLLQSAQEERVEKQQILETFGEPYIFLFGQRARMITFQGVLLNTFDFNWEAEWWENYDRFIRGTRCVESDAMVFLSFDQTVVGGYIVGASCTKASEQPYLGLNFSFQMFVVSYSNFSAIGDPNAKLNTADPIGTASSDADPFRPQLIIPSEVLVQRANQNLAQQPGLVEGLLEAGASKLNQIVTAVDQAINTVTGTVNNLLNGTVVRVPVGFEGVVAFEDDGAIPIPGRTAGPVTFSTFDRNDDEYVGYGSQYASSFVGIGNRAGVADQLAKTELAYDQGLVKKAQGEWLKFGMQLPGNELGPVSSFLVGKGVGLLAAGASQAWKTGSITAGANTALAGAEVTTGFTTASALANNGQLARSTGVSQLGRRGGGGSGG